MILYFLTLNFFGGFTHSLHIFVSVPWASTPHWSPSGAGNEVGGGRNTPSRRLLVLSRQNILWKYIFETTVFTALSFIQSARIGLCSSRDSIYCICPECRKNLKILNSIKKTLKTSLVANSYAMHRLCMLAIIQSRWSDILERCFVMLLWAIHNCSNCTVLPSLEVNQ